MSTTQRIFHLSDVHFGREHKAALEWSRRAIADEDPDAVIISGDLTMRARHREYAAAREWISQLAPPVMVEVGNHDLPYFNMVERFAAPYRRFRALRAAVGSEFRLTGLAPVVLRSTPPLQPRWPWADGYISARALAVCLSRIDALPAGERALVVAHHPLPERGSDGRRLTIGGKRALEELAQRNVAAVISGHVHDAFDLVEETAFGPIRMIGAGTLSTRLRNTSPSFNVLTWDGAELSSEARDFDDTDGLPAEVAVLPEGPAPD